MKMKHGYILGFLLLSVQLLCAQIEFKTVVSKSKLGLNQRLKIEFSINKQGSDNFAPPSFVNFKIVGGPSQSVNQSWINGKVSYALSYVYIIQPKSVGTFTIEAATVEYKGKVVKSNTVQINVTNSVTIAKDPNDPMYAAQEGIHLVAEISNTKPFVGEGIYVVYKLFVSENISVHDWRTSENPQYNGFWNQDINVGAIKVKKGTYNGDNTYRYIVLKRAILIPQKSGKLSIDPIKMDFNVGIPTGRGDFFGNAITRNISYSAASPKRSIFVQTLPDLGKPLDFTGAVGDFTFSVVANRNVLKANETAQIKVQVKGTGNLKLFEIPKIIAPSELEVYTPEHKEQVSTALGGLRGGISDTYTVVPEYKGKYKIPAVSFSYFSVKDKKYATIKSTPIFIEVTEGKPLPSSVEDTVAANKMPVALNGNDFKYIATSSTFEPIATEDFFKSNLFYLLLFLPFLAIPIGVFLGKKRAERTADVFGNKIRKADRLARKYLSKAKKELGNKEPFYIALEKALHNFLKAKLYIETSDISKDRITEILKEKQVDDVVIKEFIAVLNDCDYARYSPATNVEMQEEFERAKQILVKLDKKI
ncbi:MAG: BatD protein [Flavobacteriaceae bacterium]|nr:MAG: BatD protein [Flavobacteriaceae bacterium]